ncbi:MORN repeat-containing protein 1-like isoform X1 [Haliotis rufescens]|uniref:MORN repeat-containing protein 1-like isoform X1 n=1 Tax=Haliotis rufescens TaxID=6454 RepID=UPI001EB0660F|nr:MORN repeat-containing protein 1-like isoform X1 [Haliotis rufescens]
MAAYTASRASYVGETTKLLRDGFGVYVYENQFFRYEGQWQRGKKHGHGRLVMKDGTFYEGLFENGEIQGHGYKYFATSGCKYTGQFQRGELHGYGIMQYKDGTMFEGEWAHNRKQGFGVLKTGENSTYEGDFVGSMRHGDGTMIYDGVYKASNGDRYDGNWVMDKRQGQGHLICRDGTEYEGQWLNDMFHGEGKMTHASGIIYEGQWVNGYPVEMTTKMAIVMDTESLELTQGQTFSVKVECHNDLGEVIQDQGRELLVSAGFKYYPTKEGSALFDMIEQVEEKPIETPFGYSIVPYPLTDHMNTDGEKEAEGEKKEEGGEVKATPELEAPPKGDQGEEEQEQDEEGGEEKGEKEAAKEGGGEEKGEKEAAKEEGEKSRVMSPTQEAAQDLVTEPTTEDCAPLPTETTPLPPPVANQRTVDGTCEWSCLQLAPPPPMYRPFLAMEEEAGQKKSKSKKLGQSKDKSLDKLDGKHSRKDGRDKTSSENIMDEKFARPGDYVIMVQDVTNPVFLRGPLPPAFMLITLQKPKLKKKDSKPNSPEKERERWDTKKHIANMQRYGH